MSETKRRRIPTEYRRRTEYKRRGPEYKRRGPVPSSNTMFYKTQPDAAYMRTDTTPTTMGGKGKPMKMHHGPATCCDSTFQGLHCWHKHLFEELGWMVLAKERGMSDKVMVYKNSIARLKQAIEQKLADTRDKDKKDDLKVLWHNVCVLMDHANHDF